MCTKQVISLVETMKLVFFSRSVRPDDFRVSSLAIDDDVPLGNAPGKTDMHGLIMGSSKDICSFFDTYLPNLEAYTHEIT